MRNHEVIRLTFLFLMEIMKITYKGNYSFPQVRHAVPFPSERYEKANQCY